MNRDYQSLPGWAKGFGFGKLLIIFESVVKYLALDQERVHLEYYHKLPDGRWALTEFKTAEANLTIESLDFEIPISRIYNKVGWFAA